MELLQIVLFMIHIYSSADATIEKRLNFDLNLGIQL